MVEKACIQYLLRVTLPTNQLSQLMLLVDMLGLLKAHQQLLQQLLKQPWQQRVMAVLLALCTELGNSGPQYDVELQTGLVHCNSWGFLTASGKHQRYLQRDSIKHSLTRLGLTFQRQVNSSTSL